MIKLIASDLDGTLLQNGAQTLTEEAKQVIAALQKKGVLFAAASGRQYPNLYRLFGELSEEMAFICENGAYAVSREEELYSIPMDRELGIAIIKDIYNRDDCEVLLSGKNTSYLQPKTEAYEYRMRYIVKNNVQVVEDLTKVEEPFLKISVYQPSGISRSEEYFRMKWSDRAQAVVSGTTWLDFTAFGVNKGHALAKIQEKLGISKEETMVFGDNYNDIEMFAQAKYSYVMENAADEIKKYGAYRSVRVEDTLKDWLQHFQAYHEYLHNIWRTF